MHDDLACLRGVSQGLLLQAQLDTVRLLDREVARKNITIVGNRLNLRLVQPCTLELDRKVATTLLVQHFFLQDAVHGLPDAVGDIALLGLGLVLQELADLLDAFVVEARSCRACLVAHADVVDLPVVVALPLEGELAILRNEDPYVFRGHQLFEHCPGFNAAASPRKVHGHEQLLSLLELLLHVRDHLLLTRSVAVHNSAHGVSRLCNHLLQEDVGHVRVGMRVQSTLLPFVRDRGLHAGHLDDPTGRLLVKGQAQPWSRVQLAGRQIQLAPFVQLVDKPSLT
mmetsp:Transcript_52017/g.102665  ORF Transcript_52017/g.102665 Transcript_52017/m.102665 type:complete len:283 (-) Transcript_52017:407-1255(-)